MYDYMQLVFVSNTVENTQMLKNMIFSALVCILCICIGCREMLSDPGWEFKFFNLNFKNLEKLSKFLGPFLVSAFISSKYLSGCDSSYVLIVIQMSSTKSDEVTVKSMTDENGMVISSHYDIK